MKFKSDKVQRVFSITHVIYALFIAGFLALYSCDEKQPAGLAADPDIQAIFTEAEIQDLTDILNFFEKQICDLNQVQQDSIMDCYEVFFKKMSSAQNTGVLYIPVPFHLQLAMYDQLSETAFKEIWLAGKTVDRTTGDTTIRLTLSFDGKYMRFLDKLIEDHQILTSYQKSFAAERKVSPHMLDAVLVNYRQFDMRDIRMRLFVALHYLTLNDTYERKNL